MERKSEKIVKPEAMMVITLDEIAGRLADLTEVENKILTHLEETTPEGIDVKFDDQTVTGATTLDFIKNYPYHPLRTIDFFNKGPSTAYYRINEEGKEIAIEDRENLTAEKPKATIKHLTLRVDSGKSTTMRLVGHY